jgi:hypothetical protein
LRVLRSASLSLVLGLLLCVPAPAHAADDWIEVKSPNFTVISDSSERRARTIAWQFEQVRGAIAKGFPWARVTLDRPVVVIAVKDERSMRAMAPQYWEGRGQIKPGSVFTSAADGHYITLRVDIEVEDQGQNPYRSAYWAYSSLVLQASFNRELPLWLTNGLAAVLSNTRVRDREIYFGQPIPEMAQEIKTIPLLSLPDLFAVTYDSPYYRQPISRDRFDTQCWALVQFMLYGEKDAPGARLNQIGALLVNGASSTAAAQQTYGQLEALETAYRLYFSQSVYTFARMQVNNDVPQDRYPLRTLPVADSAGLRARWHVALQRPVEAQKMIAEVRLADPAHAGGDDAEAMLLDRDNSGEEARLAFARAVERGSTSFWSYYRLATLNWKQTMTPEEIEAMRSQLVRATELNPGFARGFAFLGTVLTRLNQPDAALEAAQRSVALNPGDFQQHLVVVRLLGQLSRTADAAKAVEVAATYARTDQQRAALTAASTPQGPLR